MLLSLLVPWRPDGAGRLQPILRPEEAFSGFGSPALVMVASMFVLSAALERTGAASLLFGRLLEAGARSEWRLQLTVLAVVTAFSAFVNDTTTVLVWMAPLLKVCRDRGIPPPRVLMPLAFASLLGGQWTLIGTRSNLIVSDYLRTRTGAGLGFFDFTPVAAAIFGVSLLYFALLGRRFLPAGRGDPTLAERYEVKEYLTEVMAAPGSEYEGRRLGDLDFARGDDIAILGVVRGGRRLDPDPALVIEPRDVLVIQGRIGRITDLLQRPGLSVREELAVGDRTLRSVDLRMVEALVARDSAYEGRTIREVGLEGNAAVTVLAVAHGGRPPGGRPLEEPLAFGDSLLLVAHESELARLRGDGNLFLLESRPLPPAGRRRAYLSIGLLGAAVAASATGLLSPSFALPLAAGLAVLLRCLGARDAYAALDLPSLFVVGGMIPYGLALERSGAAERFASMAVSGLGAHGPWALLLALLLLTVLLTQLIENAAVAIILAPIAYELASASGSDPRPFLIGVAICVSSAFSTPVAHESTILVFGPGRYRFADYLRVGGPLVLITWLVASALLPLLFPF